MVLDLSNREIAGGGINSPVSSSPACFNASFILCLQQRHVEIPLKLHPPVSSVTDRHNVSRLPQKSADFPANKA